MNPAWSSYFRTLPVSPLLGGHPHPLLWHLPRSRGPPSEPQPCLWAAHATPQKCLHESVGRPDIPVSALGHLSIAASLQTIWEETVLCRHTGTPLASKHRACTSLSGIWHFPWLTLRENMCAKALKELMSVPLFNKLPNFPGALAVISMVFNSPTHQHGSPTWVPRLAPLLALMGSFRLHGSSPTSSLALWVLQAYSSLQVSF